MLMSGGMKRMSNGRPKERRSWRAGGKGVRSWKARHKPSRIRDTHRRWSCKSVLLAGSGGSARSCARRFWSGESDEWRNQRELSRRKGGRRQHAHNTWRRFKDGCRKSNAWLSRLSVFIARRRRVVPVPSQTRRGPGLFRRTYVSALRTAQLRCCGSAYRRNENTRSLLGICHPVVSRLPSPTTLLRAGSMPLRDLIQRK
mmetsp:Transcript_42835/g.77833  ORF Transcript_42835/g.77833 Transcript_42835/m.77833 type:complete len:200 (-) Transcript_42835:315-914(-)